ncbi:dicarboxylate/amino acid:cation (Na or H) symporter (DAACS) family protein [Achlya hypogyna]|uniref:Amino acid transporter n=1 Tax=Achlya hypogyna TaxID=1202772 RepID=A0A1V9YH10_ACHHY|nr:dicarboxylate/amino acid:cation (Na or H) symporter (DAACS) family protein [Achlya hypogyna]
MNKPPMLSSGLSSTSSQERRPAHYESSMARTNFRSTPQDTAPSTPPVGLYALQDDPILEGQAPAAPHGNYDSRETATFFNSMAVVIGAGLGIGLGLILSKFNISTDLELWLELPGNLFVRALRCLIVPMVFCTMTVSIAEIVVLNKTSILTWRTAAVLFSTSVLSTMQGMVVALVYNSVFNANWPVTAGSNSTNSILLGFKCANGMYLESLANGSMACDATVANASALFTISDVNHVLSTNTAFQDLTLTEQVIAIINLVVPDNIFSALATGSLLSVLMFALPLGVAVAKSHSDSAGSNYLLTILRQSRNTLLLMINAVLKLTPFAVFFLLTSSIVSYSSNKSTNIVSQGGYLILFFVGGVLCHVLVVMPIFLFLFTRKNPYHYLRQLVPAYVFAFGCSSSMATLPVAVTVVHQTRQVSRQLAQLMMCLGTPVNLNAPGLYYPLMTVFMANVAGVGGQLRGPELVVLFFVSLLGCMGTAPVPNSALVMLMTVWKTVLPNVALPGAFVYVVAIDFLLDRICTSTNVNGNMIVTRILADYFDDSWGNESVQA